MWHEHLPHFLTHTHFWGVEAWQWLGLVLALLGAWVSGAVFGSLVVGVAKRIARRTTTAWDDALVGAARGPTRTVVAVAALRFLVDPLHLSPPIERIAQRISFTLLVVGIAWFIMRSLDVFAEWVVARLPTDGVDDNHARGIRTQLSVLQRVGSVITVVVASAVILIQFDFVRSVGLSLLASAGVVGIVFGIAAQKSLAGVIAGIQLSITQPIRIGDTVVVEGEFGTIEEINLTYVVVKVWDERRLVIPIARFLDQPFQNWTKVSPQILGTVLVQADYATPVDAVRAELGRVCEASAFWDKRTCTLKVTEATDKVITLRALVSAANADASWNLRCEVRELLIKFLRELDSGAYLPKIRSEAAVPVPAKRPPSP